MLDAIKHITNDNFSFRKIAHRCIVCNTIQLSEICDFRVFVFCQVVQKHKLFEVAKESIFFAYFIGNISTKKYQNPFMCVKKL